MAATLQMSGSDSLSLRLQCGLNMRFIGFDTRWQLEIGSPPSVIFISVIKCGLFVKFILEE